MPRGVPRTWTGCRPPPAKHLVREARSRGHYTQPLHRAGWASIIRAQRKASSVMGGREFGVIPIHQVRSRLAGGEIPARIFLPRARRYPEFGLGNGPSVI